MGPIEDQTKDNREDAGPIVAPHLISVVVPVYKGETTLESLLAEMSPLTSVTLSPSGTPFKVEEVLLVFDNGPDRSAEVIRMLKSKYDFVRDVWLSRNFGQHSATLAGMASSGSEWIVTLDEDGQHDPRDIGKLLDAALAKNSSLVYARPTNSAPHGTFRNAASRLSKSLVSKLSPGQPVNDYQSFRLILGEVGRAVAAYAGAGVYLDVALGWIASRTTTADVELRSEGGRLSGYSQRKLLSHFWRLVLTSGTRALRLVSLLGVLLAMAGFLLGVYFIVERLLGGALPLGFTSTITVILFSSGAVLIALGVIAEYLGVAVNAAMGKPLYLIVSDPNDGPLGRRQATLAR